MANAQEYFAHRTKLWDEWKAEQAKELEQKGKTAFRPRAGVMVLHCSRW
jgi:hypothetical protein